MLNTRNNKTLIIYHVDLDGHASGAILQRYLKRENPEMVRINYNDPFPWEKIDKDTNVWMADFSLEPWEEMIRLQKQSKILYWIDHHKTAMESYIQYLQPGASVIRGLRIDGEAACSLCWRYTHGGMEPPKPIYLASVYDIWKWQGVEGAIEFQHGARVFETDPATEEGKLFWDEIFDSPHEKTEEVIELGKLLIPYRERSNHNFMKSSAFETEIDGLKVVAVNRKGNSQQFDSVWDPEKHDAMLTFAWQKGCWTVSLYTDREDVDVSVIAKRYGGGGHRGAAGFSTQNLPFSLR
jgi:oligoribonuclease NrnB/cAMP/cGMP phosphodiesterase (DHH superfamily)